MLKKKDVELVQWFMDFLYCDFDKLADGDIAKIITDLRSIIIMGLSSTRITNFKDKRNPSSSRVAQINLNEILEVKAFQERFKIIFDKIMYRRERIAEYEESDWLTYAESETIDGINILDEPLKITFEAIPSITVPKDYNIEEDEIKIKWSSDWRKQSSFALDTQTPGYRKNSENVALFAFFRHLAGIPLKSFMRCEDCDRWFLHISKRKRKFCNNLCAARKANKIRRKNLKLENSTAYKEEKKKSRERANKSYENKIKKVNPKAKISRRPRKKS